LTGDLHSFVHNPRRHYFDLDLDLDSDRLQNLTSTLLGRPYLELHRFLDAIVVTTITPRSKADFSRHRQDCCIVVNNIVFDS
jgi:hypothetical protein